jgi:hypothetical protein
MLRLFADLMTVSRNEDRKEDEGAGMAAMARKGRFARRYRRSMITHQSGNLALSTW